MLIGFGHAARVGKSTAAKILVDRYGFTHLSFAEPIRNILYATAPGVAPVVDRYGWDGAKERYPFVREYMISLGNSARTHIHPDIWTDTVFRRVRRDRDYVISDVRYPNEVERIKKFGGYPIKITRPGISPLSDATDQALVNHNGWHMVIENNGSKEDLAGVLCRFLVQGP